MRTQITHSDIISGNDLYDFEIRKHYESIMGPSIMDKLHLILDLEPYESGNDLRVCFYNFPKRITLRVPVHMSFSVSQMLERIYEQYEEKFLPSLMELFASSECDLCELGQIINKLNNKTE